MGFQRLVICIERGCGQLTDQPPRCADHSTHRATPPTTLLPRTRYGPAWQRLSKQLRDAQPWCSKCGSNIDLTLDHILPGTGAGGYQVLCRRCNSAKAGQDRALRRMGHRVESGF